MSDDTKQDHRNVDNPGPDPDPVDLGTHIVMGPALRPRCELGHPLAILDGSHVRPWEMAAHGKR
jgi:hypothetical protein